MNDGVTGRSYVLWQGLHFMEFSTECTTEKWRLANLARLVLKWCPLVISTIVRYSKRMYNIFENLYAYDS